MIRDELRTYLLESRICGATRTPRADVVRKAVMLSQGDEDALLGLDFVDLSLEEVMDAVAGLCGCSPDPDVRDGEGYIDPDRTLSMLEALAARLAQAARRGERVLIVTGHPTGLLPMYMAVARALEACGAKLLTPRDDEKLGADPRGKRRNRIRYLEGVGVLHDGASLFHTHDAWPMERLLEGLDAPDLVLGDHGYAGAAVSLGIETVSFADVNDPALAVARARGKTEIVVPLDDNVPPALYGPLAAFLETAIRG
jgi:hypothetical protein